MAPIVALATRETQLEVNFHNVTRRWHTLAIARL